MKSSSSASSASDRPSSSGHATVTLGYLMLFLWDILTFGGKAGRVGTGGRSCDVGCIGVMGASGTGAGREGGGRVKGVGAGRGGGARENEGGGTGRVGGGVSSWGEAVSVG